MLAVPTLLEVIDGALLRDEPGSRTTLLGNLDTESVGQPLHVLPVDVVELLIHVPAHLELRGDAWNVDAADPPSAEQPFAGPPMRIAARAVGLPTVAAFVELQRMAIDLAS